MGKPHNVHSRERSKTYFYIDEKLYKYINANRAMGMVYARDVNNNSPVIFSYSDFKKRSYWAYTCYGAAIILNRNRTTITRLIAEGKAPSTNKVFKNEEKEKQNKTSYIFLNRTAIKQLHTFLAVSKKGAARKDGTVKQIDIPTIQELEAELNNEIILYAKSKDGKNFVRVWQAEQEEGW